MRVVGNVCACVRERERMSVPFTHMDAPTQCTMCEKGLSIRMYKARQADTSGVMVWNAKGKHSTFMILAILTEL